MKPLHVLVTGGAGFIGGHLVAALLAGGWEVSVLDNFSTGQRDRVPHAARLIEGDVRDVELISAALAGVDAIVHLAARVTIRGSVDAVAEDLDVNLGGTLAVLAALEGHSIRRFINASSMAVYSDSPGRRPIDEQHPTLPLSPYGISKLAAENHVRLACSAANISAANLRYFNTWGPGQRLTPYVGVITIFLDRLHNGQPVQVFGDGRQTRDFIHVDDVVAATMAALTRDLEGVPSINIGTGRGTSVGELAAMVAAAVGCPDDRHHVEARSEELTYSVADVTRARALLGCVPARTLSVAALAELASAARRRA